MFLFSGPVYIAKLFPTGDGHIKLLQLILSQIWYLRWHTSVTYMQDNLCQHAT